MRMITDILHASDIGGIVNEMQIRMSIVVAKAPPFKRSQLH